MSKIFADISHWQGSINWDKYPYDTVIMKCTQGVSYVDPTFATNRIKATAKGIKCGYYHFADNNDPIKEAKHFLNTVGVLVCGEFVALDSETGQTADWCKKWLEYVEEKVGFKPLLYAPVSGWKVSLNYPLWVARYGINNGSVDYNNPPKIGKWKEYKIWQYTSKGFVNGISGNVDMNIYENIDDIGKQSKQEIDTETSENPQPTVAGRR